LSNPITYILADDEVVFRDLTLDYLSRFPDMKCLAVCEDAFSTLEAMKKQLPDLLILDVEMPGMTGLQLAKALTTVPLIIFITSHTHYAADAFDVDAIDYLVKPITPERLYRSVEKARKLLELRAAVPATEAFRMEIATDAFFVKDKSTYVRISCNDVRYIESLGDFVTIYLDNGQKQLALVSLKNLEKQLPDSLFIRVSRTYMVNRNKISAIDSEMVSLGAIQLPLGKTYAETVLQTVLGNNAIKRFL
jgi:two-component system, LytTR family, response regulator